MRILVAGSSGLVGSAITRALEETAHEVVKVNSSVVDLTDRQATFDFVSSKSPDAVIDAAAKVGGIGANDSMPVEFLSRNIQIQTNLMDAAYAANVGKFVFLGSSCIYPRDAQQTIKEESLLTGPLEATNSAYAIAKIAGIELIRSYRRQYGRRWISLMPTNLYGPGDNFDLATSHVVPALIRKFSEAVESGSSEVVLWGTGTPRREFLHVDDLARAVLLAMEIYDDDQILNVGVGSDVTIRELAEIVALVTGFQGEIVWDETKPDGTPRKVLDVSRMMELGWSPQIKLKDGIIQTLAWYRNNQLKGEAR